MATDNSPPRNKIIFVGAVVVVAILVLLKFAFDSYFIMMMEGEAAAKMAQPTELHALRAEEQKKLTQSPLPIDQAMHQLGQLGDRNSNPLITPQPSPDEAPMIGWAKGTRALAATSAGSAGGAGSGGDAGGASSAGGADAGAQAVPNQDTLMDSGAVHALADAGAVHALADAGAVHALADAGSVHTLADGGTHQ
jgi:hypothetical protein